MNITVWIYSIMLLVILLAGASYAGRDKFIDNFFALGTTKAMQGYFALWILIHHIALSLRFYDFYRDELVFFENLGTLFVGFFFLCSGYGLIYSYETKPGYLDTFVKRRVITVLVPFFICNYAYMITGLILGNQFTTGQLVRAFFGILLLNDHMWFAVEIMILYMIFYFIFRYIRDERLCYVCMAICILVMMIGSFLAGHNTENTEMVAAWFKGEWWYNTTPLFFVGMMGAKYRNSLTEFAKKYYKRLVVLLVAAFLILYHFTIRKINAGGYWTESANDMAYGDKLQTLALQLPMVLCFELLVVLILMKVQFHNRVLVFLGKISLEVILLEKVFMLIFAERPVFHNVNMYSCAVVVATILFAACIEKIKRIVLEKK